MRAPALELERPRSNSTLAARDEFLARLVTSQGYTIASTEIFWLSGCMFLALMALVWLARRPSPASASAAVTDRVRA